jgi:hypothetical protein
MLQQDGVEQSRQDALLTEYSEVSSNFRMLADIRFKPCCRRRAISMPSSRSRWWRAQYATGWGGDRAAG